MKLEGMGGMFDRLARDPVRWLVEFAALAMSLAGTVLIGNAVYSINHMLGIGFLLTMGAAWMMALSLFVCAEGE